MPYLNTHSRCLHLWNISNVWIIVFCRILSKNNFQGVSTVLQGFNKFIGKEWHFYHLQPEKCWYIYFLRLHLWKLLSFLRYFPCAVVTVRYFKITLLYALQNDTLNFLPLWSTVITAFTLRIQTELWGGKKSIWLSELTTRGSVKSVTLHFNFYICCCPESCSLA